MRKITFDSINAFMNNREFSRANTKVTVSDGLTVLYLHGNAIAIKCHTTNQLEISHSGWPTATTKERLNGIPNVSIRQKDYKWYLNGELWDGDWIEVN